MTIQKVEALAVALMSVTHRQLEVLHAVIDAGTYKEAAVTVGITENGVRNSLASSRKRMGNLTTFQLAYTLGFHAALAYAKEVTDG